MLSFENTVIVYNKDVPESYKVAQKAAELFDAKLVTPDSFIDSASFVVTVGGDGTILRAARYYAKSGVPIFGINLGRLGFLAQAKPDELDWALNKLKNGEYNIQNRMMLSSFENKVTALNDIVIKGDTFSRTSRLYLSIDGKQVCDYLADGLIISTPTGSTAYTLSAGGPVISPGLDAVVIVPICPHTLTARPLVVPADEKIEVSSCDTCSGLKLSADGQNTVDVSPDEKIIIQKSGIMAKLVVLNRKNNGFYSLLREKLQWGVAPR